MASEASLKANSHLVAEFLVDAGAALEPGDVLQHYDGRAAVVAGKNDPASGDTITFYTSGVFQVDTAAATVIRRGQPLWWDESANVAVTVWGAAGDFYLGTSDEDVDSSTTTVRVDLNAKPNYLMKTGAGDGSIGFGEIQNTGTNGRVEFNGDWVRLNLSATSEAATVSWMSAGEVPVDDPWMADIFIEIWDDGDAGSSSTMDFFVGLVNDSHATDHGSITESVGFSMTGNTVNILGESDDGTSENGAADTTVDYTLATATAPAVSQMLIDARDKDAILLYVNGAAVLTSLTFKLTAATGPMKLLASLEKTADTTTADYRIKAGVRRFDLGAAT